MENFKVFEQTKYIDGNTEFIYMNGKPLSNEYLTIVYKTIDQKWLENNYDLFIYDGQYYAMNNESSLPIYEEASNIEELIGFLYIMQYLQNNGKPVELDDVFKEHYKRIRIDDFLYVYIIDIIEKVKE
jgi:hypothetical protein